MIQDIINQLNGQSIQSIEVQAKTDSRLPFELIDRYTDIQPMPIITWRYSSYDFDSIYDLAINYTIAHDKPVAQALYESAKYGPGTGYIVELGTQFGCGTCMLASGSKASRREKVITIDDDRGEMRSIYSNEFWERHPVEGMRFEMNCLMMGVHDWIIPIGTSTKWAAENLNIKVRVLFIDANHTYEGCAGDILLWKDKVMQGGLILIHDYDYSTVKQAVNDYIVNSVEFTDIIELTPQMIITQKKGTNAQSPCNNAE